MRIIYTDAYACIVHEFRVIISTPLNSIGQYLRISKSTQKASSHSGRAIGITFEDAEEDTSTTVRIFEFVAKGYCGLVVL